MQDEPQQKETRFHRLTNGINADDEIAAAVEQLVDRFAPLEPGADRQARLLHAGNVDRLRQVIRRALG
jgi:hypothetical protein